MFDKFWENVSDLSVIRAIPGQLHFRSTTAIAFGFFLPDSPIKKTFTMPKAKKNIEWMPAPEGAIPGCPPGLEYLCEVDQLLVHQEVELLEVLVGFETANKYAIKNSMGQQVFYAAEDSNCLCRQICGPIRQFEMKILDNSQQEIIHLLRPFRNKASLCCCLRQEIEVQAPPGSTVGFVRQAMSFCKPVFDICAADGTPQLRIVGPVCQFNICCGDVIFHVYAGQSEDEADKIGEVRKQFSGAVKELFTDADNFGVTFPADLAVTTKATLLASTFLIDFMFFEKAANED